jgi:ribonuclease-3
MPDLTIIFRTHSLVEANIVRGLLETHGIQSLVSSDALQAVFPLAISGPGEVRLAVLASEAHDASRIIAEHRAEVGGGRLVALRDEYDSLQARLGHRFRDRGLLEHALTHRSHAHEDVTGGILDNESLEFLGDAVLGFVVADLLFREFPRLREGEKSKIKAALVSTAALSRVAERLDLGQYILLGRGEEKTGGRLKQALLADACEALIAAVYLDGGMEAAARLITRELRPEIDEYRRRGGSAAGTSDFKSALQERLQAKGGAPPEYIVTGTTGPDHRKLFQVDVRVAGETLASAEGRSKKEAEQQAAREGLRKLGSSDR